MPAHGQGSLSNSPRVPPGGGGPPFPAGAANNGLSVDPGTGLIVLGQNPGEAGNPAILLGPREIPTGGNVVYFLGPGPGFDATSITAGEFSGILSTASTQFHLNTTGNLFLTADSAVTTPGLGARVVLEDIGSNLVDWVVENRADLFLIEDNVNNNRLLEFTSAAGGNNITARIGDITGNLNLSRLFLDDPNNALTFSTLLSTVLIASGGGSPVFKGGDLLDNFGGTKFVVDDTTLKITGATAAGGMLELDQSTGGYRVGDIDGSLNSTNLDIDDPSQIVGISSSASRGLFLDLGAFSYSIGDTNNTGNGTKLQIDDNNKNAILTTTAGRLWVADQGAGSYFFGDIDSTGSGSLLSIDDGNQIIKFNFSGSQFFELSKLTGTYQMGDIAGTGNGTILQLNDTAANIQLRDTNGYMLLLDRANGDFIFGSDGFANNTKIQVNDTGQYIEMFAVNGIRTNDPGGGQGSWLLGKVIAAASVFDATQYVETMIDGVVVKLAVAA